MKKSELKSLIKEVIKKEKLNKFNLIEMNSFTFYQNLANNNNNKINVITKEPRGYRVITIKDGDEYNEMDGKNYKIYKSVNDAKKSPQLKKYKSFPLFQVIPKGTDFKDAKVTKLIAP